MDTAITFRRHSKTKQKVEVKRGRNKILTLHMSGLESSNESQNATPIMSMQLQSQRGK